MVIKNSIKSNKGYVFTYEAIIVAFIFVSIFYVGYLAYSHNFLTTLGEEKDIGKFDKAIYLKDYYLKKYSFPGNYSTTYMANFISRFNFKGKTFDIFHNFSRDKGNFEFIIHPTIYDKFIANSPVKYYIKPTVLNFSDGKNFTIYSNVYNTSSVDTNFSLEGNYIVFNENAYIPKITYHNTSDDSPELYGCSGDVIYFLISGTNIKEAYANIYTNVSNTFSEWSDWKYISPIIIKNRQDTELTGYAVKIPPFNSAKYIADGEMNKDCSDVRFIDSSGNELNYWIEPNTIDTDHTIAWVKVNLGANEIKKIYMLYGNPNAKSDSDGSKTFMFFDNFSDDELTNWDYNFNNPLFINSTYPNGIKYTFLRLNYSYYNPPNQNNVHITSNSIYDDHVALRFHADFHQDYDEWAGFYTIEPNGLDYNRQIISNYHWGGEYLRFESSEIDENHIVYRILPISYYNSWHTYEIQRNGDNSVNLLVDDNFYRSINNYIYTGELPISFYARKYDTSQTGYNPPNDEKNGFIDVDWVFARKYLEPEPEVISNSSEVIFTVNGEIYRKPLLSITSHNTIDITPSLKNNGVNEIRILNSMYPIVFSFDTYNNADFYYVVFSPRNITIMVKP